MEQNSAGGQLTPSEDIKIEKEESACGGSIDTTLIEPSKEHKATQQEENLIALLDGYVEKGGSLDRKSVV